MSTLVIDLALLLPSDLSLSHKKVSRTAVVSQVTTLESEVAALKRDVETLKAENKNLKEWKKTTIADSEKSKNNSEKMAQELTDLKRELDKLKNSMNEMTKVMVSVKEESSGIESVGPENDGLDKEGRLAVELSAAHANSNIFKVLIQAQFVEALDCSGKLMAEVLPPYPSNCKVKENGKQTMPATTATIEYVSKDDHEACIIQKFKDLAKEVKQFGKAVVLDVSIVQDEGVAGGLEEGQNNVKEVKKEDVTETKKSVHQSQQQGKLKMHIKKQTALPSDNKWWNTKYDAAMTATLMSEDEDYDDEKGKLVSGQYLSHPPVY